MLVPSSRAFLGSLDLSIRVITPRLKLSRVKNCCLGKFFGVSSLIDRGIYDPHTEPELSGNFHGLAQLPELLSSCIVLSVSSASCLAEL